MKINLTFEKYGTDIKSNIRSKAITLEMASRVGIDGKTPYIKDGNWWIGNEDTGESARGRDGDNGATPYIENGTWWINGVDTGVSAMGISDYVHPNDANTRHVTDAEKAVWNGKQSALVSGENIKTINGTSVLGSGNIEVGGSGGSSAWGDISGNIDSQTDLVARLNNFQPRDTVVTDPDTTYAPADATTYHFPSASARTTIQVKKGGVSSGNGYQIIISKTTMTVTLESGISVQDGTWSDAIAAGAKRVITVYRVGSDYFANCQRYV